MIGWVTTKPSYQQLESACGLKSYQLADGRSHLHDRHIVEVDHMGVASAGWVPRENYEIIPDHDCLIIHYCFVV